MLLPDELKRDDFSRAIRGYATAEVDDYIDFLIEKYRELDQKNDELERQLAVATNRLNEYREREEQLVEMKKEAQRISASLIAGAEAKSGRIMNEAEIYCRSAMTDLDEKIAQKRAVVDRLTSIADDFKDKLFAMYAEHISMLEKTTELADAAFDSVVEITRGSGTVSEKPISSPTVGDPDLLPSDSADADSASVAGSSDVSRTDIRETPHDTFDFDDIIKKSANGSRQRASEEMSLTSEFELVYSNTGKRRRNNGASEKN